MCISDDLTLNKHFSYIVIIMKATKRSYVLRVIYPSLCYEDAVADYRRRYDAWLEFISFLTPVPHPILSVICALVLTELSIPKTGRFVRPFVYYELLPVVTEVFAHSGLKLV